MSVKVYITYENSMRANVTGVYANEKLAEKEAKERGDLSIIDSFEIKGYRGDNFELEIYDDCKYYIPRLNTIRELIACLYNLEGCCTGGLAHIITDDDNIEDHHIKFVLEECEKNKDKEEAGLVKLICEELLKLSIQQRVLLFSSYYSYFCDKDCARCAIQQGNMDFLRESM